MLTSVQDILFLQNRVAYTRDEQAYKKLFFHFHPALYRFANNIIKDGLVADEIVSDVMMKIWDMGNNLVLVDKLNQYLFTAVKNSCLTYLVKKKNDFLAIDAVSENAYVDTNSNPENILLFSEVQLTIEAAINNLPPQCKLVYRLIKDEGFSYKEVIGILQISQNTLETHMRIALKKISIALTNYLVGKKS